jgi:hypothetical protein
MGRSGGSIKIGDIRGRADDISYHRAGLGAVSPRHFGWRSHMRWLRQELRSGIGTCATFVGTK